MHHAIKDLPILEDYGDGFCRRRAECVGIIVSNELFPERGDATMLFKGLPGDMCQLSLCSHVTCGRARIKRKNDEVVLMTRDVYYLGPEHMSVLEEDTEILWFSAEKAYQKTFDPVSMNSAAAQMRE